jgi:hypothetical protein
VDGAGDEFLARAALSGDHHGGIAACHAAYHSDNLLHGLGTANDFIPVLLYGEPGV